jgi:hypothetical protein
VGESYGLILPINVHEWGVTGFDGQYQAGLIVCQPIALVRTQYLIAVGTGMASTKKKKTKQDTVQNISAYFYGLTKQLYKVGGLVHKRIFSGTLARTINSLKGE